MDGWTIGLIAVVVLGVAAILVGAFVDRSRTRRARAEMLSPPSREIPRFAPDQPAPTYLSELQARRPPPDRASAPLSEQDRALLDDQLRSPSAVSVDAPLLSESFVTDPVGHRAVLEHPLVLLCADEISSIREVLPAMERSALGSRPLVIAAPAIRSEVLGTLEVNAIQGKLSLVAVRAESSAQAMISELTSAATTTSSDRQAGYFPADSFGSAPRWVASRRDSLVLTSDAELAT